jgi:hypothetical protein
MKATVILGTEVQIAKDAQIPTRYQGRTGFVVGTIPVGRGFRYEVSPVGGRRVTPLVLNTRQFDVL